MDFSYHFTEEDTGNIQCCRSFKYTKKAMPLLKVTGIGIGIILLFMLAGLIAMMVFAQPMQVAIVFLMAGFIIMIIFVISQRQGGVMSQLTQYFRDEQGEYYMIQFLRGASCRNTALKQNYVEQDLLKAQDTTSGYYYVKRYKEGYKDYDAMLGGEAKVVKLEHFILKKQGRKKSTYTCCMEGKKKTLKILNVYAGLLESVKGVL